MAAATLHARATVAALTRHRGAGAAETIRARQELAAARIEDVVTKIVASAPPLSDDQRARLAMLLLRGSAPAGAPPLSDDQQARLSQPLRGSAPGGGDAA